MPTTIDYYFSPQSPWTYLGHERFVKLARDAGAAVRVLPADYGQVFAVSGGLPLPKRAPQRQAYRLVELARCSEHLGLPMNVQPRHFPVGRRPAAGLLMAVEQADGARRRWPWRARLHGLLGAAARHRRPGDAGRTAGRSRPAGAAAGRVARGPGDGALRATPRRPSPPGSSARRAMWSAARSSGARTGSTLARRLQAGRVNEKKPGDTAGLLRDTRRGRAGPRRFTSGGR